GPFSFARGGETMARPEKEAMVREIKARLSKAQGAVLADYRGLNAEEMTQLRREARNAGVEFKVLKNTLTVLAARELDMNDLEPYVAGPAAVAVGYDGAVAPAKVVSGFAKKSKDLEIKGGIVEGGVIGAEAVANPEDLPGREELLSMVLRGMQAPM